MNNNRIVFLSIFLFCSFYISGCNSANEQEKFITENLVGKWKGEIHFTDGFNNRVEEIQIDIVDAQHLFYYSNFDLVSDDRDPYGIPLTIQLVSEEQIIVHGRIIDTWDIEIRDSNLLISGGILFGKDPVVLRRVPRVERILVSLGGILIVGLIGFMQLSKVNQIVRESLSDDQKTNRFRKIFRGVVDFSLHVLIIIFTLAIFVWGFQRIMTSKWFYFLGMPWRALIIMEASVCLLIVGRIVRGTNGKSIESPTFTPGAAEYYLSMALSIFSASGIIVGLVMWLMFMFLVRSYLGSWYLF